MTFRSPFSLAHFKENKFSASRRRRYAEAWRRYGGENSSGKFLAMSQSPRHGVLKSQFGEHSGFDRSNLFRLDKSKVVVPELAGSAKELKL